MDAFECAVKAVGMDIASAPLWVDYLKFVKSQQPISALEESRKMDQMRKLFQRIVVLPLQSLERTFRWISFFYLLTFISLLSSNL
jgi:cleavage stimulation factor subunit 3